MKIKLTTLDTSFAFGLAWTDEDVPIGEYYIGIILGCLLIKFNWGNKR